ncbi:hypothetical protein KDA_56050 [Dictyobacter alpinus]|uniref:ESX-1 secretion-associated protein n=1 Tax=Dictyobacter alpinus TaxID=2014873 RepID=A0A402BFD5_9CHLR|nr:hypothetical protein [Dictyobacter alpinus]GCE30121.1 hypothetical protein KDA_56050 [Dictyobacter alpinus]
MSDSSQKPISYPTGHMVEVAGQMLHNARNGLAEHEAAWTNIRGYVNSLFGFLQGPIFAVINPYEQHLRKSYQWQIDCANAILSAAGQMSNTDKNIANGFTPYPGFDLPPTK